MRSASERSAVARGELEEALNAIEDKLNVPKQLGILSTRARGSWQDNPRPWIIGAAAAVIVVGGIIALSVLGDD